MSVKHLLLNYLNKKHNHIVQVCPNHTEHCTDISLIRGKYLSSYKNSYISIPIRAIQKMLPDSIAKTFLSLSEQKRFAQYLKDPNLE